MSRWRDRLPGLAQRQLFGRLGGLAGVGADHAVGLQLTIHFLLDPGGNAPAAAFLDRLGEDGEILVGLGPGFRLWSGSG